MYRVTGARLSIAPTHPLLCAPPPSHGRDAAAEQTLIDTRGLLARAAAAALGSDGQDPDRGGHAASPDGSPARATVRMQDYPAARLVTLNRPQSLNATDLGMQCLLRRYLIDEPHAQDAGNVEWERARAAFHGRPAPTPKLGPTKEGCVYVLQGAGGRSFCAGGDILAMMHDDPPGVQFAGGYVEYQLDYYLWCAAHRARRVGSSVPSTPAGDHPARGNVVVCLLNGYVMGGGGGLCMNSHIRIAAPNSVFAMPECAIGFFPDTGASYFLPRLDIPSEFHPGRGTPGLGLYLGLTAARLKGADLLRAGIATHLLPDPARFPALAEALCQARSPRDVPEILAHYCAMDEATVAGAGPGLLGEAQRQVLARCFTLSPAAAADAGVTPVRSVEEVVERVAREAVRGETAARRAFACELMEQFAPVADEAHGGAPHVARVHETRAGSEPRRPPPALSPTAMKLTFDMQRRGLGMTDEAPALALEYAAGLHACDGDTDFMTGVRAMLVEKQRASAPAWRPPRLSGVDGTHVEAFFRPRPRHGLQPPTWNPFTPFEELTIQ